jgi:hypothetical protein
MSTEPERHIEKQIKAYANKRRAEAGAPFEMHPATRNLLQAEVARSIRERRCGGSFRSQLSISLWPRIAFGVSMLAVLVVGTWLFLQTHKEPNKSFELAKNVPTTTVRSADESETKGIAPKTMAEVARPEGRMDRDLTTPNELPQVKTAPTEKRFVAAPKLADQKKAESTSVPIAELGLKPTVVPAARQPAVGQPNVNNPGATVPALSAAPVPVKPATPSLSAIFYAGKETDRLNSEMSSVSSATQGFARVDTLPKRSTDGDRSELKTVLLSFQMEQTGDQVRVIDRDGSTYAGYLQKADATSEQQIAGGKDQAANREQKTKALIATQSAKLEGTFGYEANQDYFFRVVGTNRGLNQQVIFTGHLLAIAGNTDISKNNLNTTAAKQLQLPVQNQTGSLLLNSRINGTALVGGSNTVEIQAVPLAPK